jgi:hypothetical protein
MLELKRIKDPEKGKIQIVAGRSTAFGRNLCPTEERAAKFALDVGRGMVIDRSGLEI